jgi:hypothetical protein
MPLTWPRAAGPLVRHSLVGFMCCGLCDEACWEGKPTRAVKTSCALPTTVPRTQRARALGDTPDTTHQLNSAQAWACSWLEQREQGGSSPGGVPAHARQPSPKPPRSPSTSSPAHNIARLEALGRQRRYMASFGLGSSARAARASVAAFTSLLPLLALVGLASTHPDGPGPMGTAAEAHMQGLGAAAGSPLSPQWALNEAVLLFG